MSPLHPDLIVLGVHIYAEHTQTIMSVLVFSRNSNMLSCLTIVSCCRVRPLFFLPHVYSKVARMLAGLIPKRKKSFVSVWDELQHAFCCTYNSTCTTARGCWLRILVEDSTSQHFMEAVCMDFIWLLPFMQRPLLLYFLGEFTTSPKAQNTFSVDLGNQHVSPVILAVLGTTKEALVSAHFTQFLSIVILAGRGTTTHWLGYHIIGSYSVHDNLSS